MFSSLATQLSASIDMQAACAFLPLEANHKKHVSEAKTLNGFVTTLVKYHPRISATLSIIQDYGNAASHAEPPRQPNPYDCIMVLCHRLIHTFHLLVDEIAPKDALGRPDLGQCPVGIKSSFLFNKVIEDHLALVRKVYFCC